MLTFCLLHCGSSAGLSPRILAWSSIRIRTDNHT